MVLPRTAYIFIINNLWNFRNPTPHKISQTKSARRTRGAQAAALFTSTDGGQIFFNSGCAWGFCSASTFLSGVDAHASAGAGGGVPPSGFRFSTVWGFGGNYVFPPITARPARNYLPLKIKNISKLHFQRMLEMCWVRGLAPGAGLRGRGAPSQGLGRSPNTKGGMGCCGKLSGAGRHWG